MTSFTLSPLNENFSRYSYLKADSGIGWDSGVHSGVHSFRIQNSCNDITLCRSLMYLFASDLLYSIKLPISSIIITLMLDWRVDVEIVPRGPARKILVFADWSFLEVQRSEF